MTDAELAEIEQRARAAHNGAMPPGQVLCTDVPRLVEAYRDLLKEVELLAEVEQACSWFMNQSLGQAIVPVRNALAALDKFRKGEP